MPKMMTLLRAVSLATLTVVASTLPTSAAGRFDVSDSGRAEPATTPVSVASADWNQAGLLPLALAVASSEAHRVAAQSADTLTPGAGGRVDLSLTTLIDLTLKHNLDIRVQSYQPALGIEAVRAREAIFDPLMRFTMALFSTTNPTAATLEGADVLSITRQSWDLSGQELIPWGGTASFSFNNQREKTNSRFATLNPSFNSGLNFQVTQPLLRDFGEDVTKREIRIAQNDQKASAESFRQQVIATATAAVDSYWDLYGKLQNLEVRRESVRLAEDFLRINRTRVEVGTMAPLEISTAQAEVARNEELLILAEHDLRTAQDRILALINTPASSPLWVTEIRPVDTPTMDDREIDVEASIRLALDMRPEVRRQRLTLLNDQIRLKYAKNQLKPGLSLTAGYGLNGLGGSQLVAIGGSGDPNDPNALPEFMKLPGGYGDALDQLSSLDFDNWRLSATFDLPIFNQAAEASHATALLNQRRDEDVLESLEQGIAVEVRRLARVGGTSRKSMDAAAVTRRLQEQRLDAEQKKFEHGLSTNFAVAQAQQDLTEARTNEVIASTNYRRALAALESATGRVLDTFGISIEQ